MWGSVLSFSEGRFFRKWPRLVGGGWRRPLTVWFGRPLPVGSSPRDARFALQELTTHGIRDRMLTTRSAEREIAAWLRRHAADAGPLQAALDEVRPYLIADGGNVEIVEIDGPIVKVRLQGACGSCPSSTMTLKMGIERKLREAIPEVNEVVQVL
jgi:Fe-S cluster biogenesis protein NfuA